MSADAELRDFPSLFSLKGKVAVVTGGSRGLGLSAASAFLQAGAAKVFISSRKAQACDEACKTLNALPNLAPGASAVSVPADISTIEGVESLVSQVKSQTSHVDILFANAGATWGEAFDTHPDSAFAKVMDLNVKGVFNTVRVFTPLLEASPGAKTHRADTTGEGARGGKGKGDDPARVIITASVAGLGLGHLGKSGTYGYSASKAAAIHLGRNLALELIPRGITVNSIAPGFFPSKMSNGLLAKSGGAEQIARSNPSGRLGRPEDIAGVVVYLTSRASSHVNGEVIAIDGGALWARGELQSKI